MTRSPRLPAMSLPRILSDAPAPYTFAVSKKLIPASRQRANIAPEVASSASDPNDIVPKQSGETCTPVLPTVTYSIVENSLLSSPLPSIKPQASPCPVRLSPRCLCGGTRAQSIGRSLVRPDLQGLDRDGRGG